MNRRMVSGMNEPVLPVLEVEKVRGWARFWPRLAAELSPSARGRVRLRTLNNLRWMAVAGQSVALFIVYFALDYPLPLFACAHGGGDQRRAESRPRRALPGRAPPHQPRGDRLSRL